MDYLLNKVAVVTGISKGIGKALTEELLKHNCIVVGWGRTKPDFEHTNLYFIPTQVDDYNSVQSAYNQTTALCNKIDFLVNNSGLGYFGYLEDLTIEQFDELIKINVYGIFNTCKAVIPHLKQNGEGHIVNISSTAGLEGMAQVSAYCGTKHAVRGISDSLYKELRDFGVKVTTVYPGSVETDFFKNSPGIKAHDKMMTPQEVAKQIVRALDTSPNFLINNIEFRPLQPKPSK
ncbi:MAG: SDR family NAD(P)-dependent oxidoreductase [Bacteroidota bacterium]|nr:SDR family NAD(P)-dependent oxidoreductase [Bacteroidota bacterium]